MILGLEAVADAAERAAGTDSRYEAVDLAVGLAPDFRDVVSICARRLATLSNWLAQMAPFGLVLASSFGKAAGIFHVVVGVLVGDCRHLDQFGAEQAKRVLLLLPLGYGDDDHRLEAHGVGDNRKADAGIAGGAFDDRSAGLQRAFRYGILDDEERGAVLHRLARVHEFGLAKNGAAGQFRGLAQFDQRRVANRGHDVRLEIHRILRGAHGRPVWGADDPEWTRPSQASLTRMGAGLTFAGVMHRILGLIAGIAVWVLCATDSFAGSDDIYQAKTIVTGQELPSRLTGFATCLADVLVKASGDPRLLADPRVVKLADHAAEYVAGFHYRDRLEGIPIHDEQGSRDRPFDLTVTFNPTKIDRALNELGSKLWRGKRPAIAMLIAVRLDTTTYVLTRDGDHGIDQRDSLAAVSWQMGVPVVLPSKAEMNLTFETLPKADGAALTALAKRDGTNLALTGTLVWNRSSLGWAADWRLIVPNGDRAWKIRDVNFDDAFRSAVRGAAQVLSGNGEPH